MQLQLLDLMIDKPDVPVSIDARVQLELIDLMASILLAVSEAQQGGVDRIRLLCSPKIKPEHLARFRQRQHTHSTCSTDQAGLRRCDSSQPNSEPSSSSVLVPSIAVGVNHLHVVEVASASFAEALNVVVRSRLVRIQNTLTDRA